MRHYSDLFLRRLQEVTRVLLAYGLFALLGSAPAVAEDFSAGQPYFSLSGMVAGGSLIKCFPCKILSVGVKLKISFITGLRVEKIS